MTRISTLLVPFIVTINSMLKLLGSLEQALERIETVNARIKSNKRLLSNINDSLHDEKIVRSLPLWNPNTKQQDKIS